MKNLIKFSTLIFIILFTSYFTKISAQTPWAAAQDNTFFYLKHNDVTKFRFQSNGDFLLGSSKLRASGNIELRGNGGARYIDFSNDLNTDYDMRIRLMGNDHLNVKGGFLSIGNVSIPASVSNNFYLFVEKGILTERVQVKLSIDWPDYVFSKDYTRMSLKEVEQFVQQNHHLPNIPSAATVEKEGIDVGEMSAKLLEKIEELTLYMIELEKKVETLEAQLKEQKE